MSWDYVLFDEDNPETGGSYQWTSDVIDEPYVPDQQITDFITRSTSPTADDTAAWEGMGSWSPVSSDANSSPWQELTAKEDTDLNGVRVFKDASDPTNIKYLNISPSGEYFLNGEKIWSPSGASSDWGALISKLGNFATSAKGIATILGAAYGMSGANKPTTGGYKGSIPNLTAIREKVKMPEYTPYSGKAVMGGKFFTDTQYTPTANTEAIEAAKTAATTTAEKYAATNPKAPDAAQSPLSLAQQKSTAVKAEAKPMSSLLDTYKIVGQPAITPEGIQFIEPVKKETPAQLDDTVVDLNTWRVNPAPVTPEGIEPNLNSPAQVSGDQMMAIGQPVTSMSTKVAGAAQGGIMQLAKGRYLRGETDGMSDKIPSSIDGVQPAALSHGEFVIPADVVSHLGNGNSDAGADQLYKMMDRVRKDRTGTTKQGKKINPDKYLGGGIADYASGGVAKFQTGGSSSSALAPSASNPFGSTASTTLAPYIGDYATGMLGRAQALAQSPYQAYTGPLTAGYSPLQQQAFTAAGNINPQATFGTSDLQQYMNPYTQLSLQPQLDELRRQAEISQQNIQGQFSKAGAFGGAREAIARSENLRNLQAAQSGIIGKGFENAFNQAMGQYNVGRQQQLSDLGALAGIGAQQRGIEQEGITAIQKQFEQEKMDPFTKLQFQQSMMQGLPVGTTSITPNLSDMQRTGITLKQATDMYEILKNIPGFADAIKP